MNELVRRPNRSHRGSMSRRIILAAPFVLLAFRSAVAGAIEVKEAVLQAGEVDGRYRLFMAIRNEGSDYDSLVSVSTDAATLVAVRRSSETGKMAALGGGIALPGHAERHLRPDTSWIELEFKGPLPDTDRIPLRLDFSTAAPALVEARVLPPAAEVPFHEDPPS